MIEKIPDQIHVQTGEFRGTTFDIIPKETFAMACRKINEIVDAVNELTSCVGQLGVEFTDETHAENVPQPIKLYVCPDGSVYGNKDVAKSHAASMFNPLPAGTTTTDRVYLEQELDRTKKQLEIALGALKEICDIYIGGHKIPRPSTMFFPAKDAIDQITALEQKE